MHRFPLHKTVNRMIIKFTQRLLDYYSIAAYHPGWDATPAQDTQHEMTRCILGSYSITGYPG